MFVINGTLARHVLTQSVTLTEELAYHPESPRQKPARAKRLSFRLVTDFAGEMRMRASIAFVVLAVLTVGGAWQTPESFSFRGLATVAINGTLATHALTQNVTHVRLSDARRTPG